MPPKVVFALAEWLLRQGWAGMALGVVLAAHCVLRTGELLALGFGQLSWADDCRSAIVSLGITKGGAHRGAAESVKIELDWLALALRAWALRPLLLAEERRHGALAQHRRPWACYAPRAVGAARHRADIHQRRVGGPREDATPA